MRCRACNDILSELELALVRKDGSSEDMCLECLSVVFDSNDDEDNSDDCDLED